MHKYDKDLTWQLDIHNLTHLWLIWQGSKLTTRYTQCVLIWQGCNLNIRYAHPYVYIKYHSSVTGTNLTTRRTQSYTGQRVSDLMNTGLFPTPALESFVWMLLIFRWNITGYLLQHICTCTTRSTPAPTCVHAGLQLLLSTLGPLPDCRRTCGLCVYRPGAGTLQFSTNSQQDSQSPTHNE